MKTLKILTLLAMIVVVSAFAVNTIDAVEDGYKVGDVATDFALKNVDGKKVSLSDYENAKGFIVIFTCNSCPFSVANEDRINALDAKYKSKGFPVIAINPNNPQVKPDDSFAMMQKRAKQKNFSFPYLLDDGQKIYPKYGATKTPHTYILEKTDKGNIVRYIGSIDNSSRDPKNVTQTFVEDAVDALLAGKAVAVETTKAIGCSIKS